MSKIKVGDKIKAKVTCVFYEKNIITWNKIYEVAHITDCETGYQVVNDVNELMIFKMCNFDNEFELVEQKTDFVVDKVIQRFRERSQLGIEKYGKTLAENNTDNFLNHLQEELMDAVNYIEKLKTQESSELFDNIRKWFDEKELIKQENASKQMMKVMEELGELSSAIIKGKRDEEIDAFGDVMIALSGLSYMRNISLMACTRSAYEVIKNRRGKVVNGSFIKE
jgi:NTP pyrophosphatase (non-canonical NTP hydrolase)